MHPQLRREHRRRGDADTKKLTRYEADQEAPGEDSLQPLAQGPRKGASALPPHEWFGLQRLTVTSEEGVDDSRRLDCIIVGGELALVVHAALVVQGNLGAESGLEGGSDWR